VNSGLLFDSLAAPAAAFSTMGGQLLDQQAPAQGGNGDDAERPLIIDTLSALLDRLGDASSALRRGSC
jgi:hypothetical protein